MPKRKKWHCNPKTPTKHHIRPTSRGGTDDDENIAIVPNKKHELYHVLFSNRTPEEIIAHLVAEYWNDQWEWVELALENRNVKGESRHQH